MKKLKVAIITSRPNWIMNGIVKYNRTLYQGPLKNCDITEYPIFNFKNDKNIMADPIESVKVSDLLCKDNGKNYLGRTTYQKKKLDHILRENDVVIVSEVNFPKRIMKHSKVFLVQHMDKRFYTLLGKSSIDFFRSIGYIFSSILFGIGSIKSGLKKSKNVIFFNKETYAKNSNNVFFAQLATKHSKEIMLDTTSRTGAEQLTWIARFKKQKQPMDAVKLANKNSNMKIYGSGPYVDKIKGKLFDSNQLVGPLMNAEVDLLMKKTKIHVVTSKIEGACFTMVEALSAGVPVVCWDTFDATKFFVNSDAVFAFRKGDFDSMQSKIDEIMRMSNEEYKELQSKAIAFARSKMSLDQFDETWKKILSNFA